MNNKSVRLQLLQYLHDYFDIKNKKVIKKGRKVKTQADVIKDLQTFCVLAKKEVPDLRKELKEKIMQLQGKNDDKKLQQMMEELEIYSNANEEGILTRLMKLFQEFNQEKDKQKKREMLIKIEDFVYSITSSESIELSWDLFSFMQECFFIYYSHSTHKAEIEYGIDTKEDKMIEQSVADKHAFLQEVISS